MNDEYIIAIIGISGTLLGVIASYIPQIMFYNYKEKKRIKNEFEYAKSKVLSLIILNDYYIYMFELKQFFIRHSNFLFQEDFKIFYNKWLIHPYVDRPQSIIDAISEEDLLGMKIELMRLKLDFTYLKERVIRRIIKKAQKGSKMWEVIEEFYQKPPK